VVFIIDCTSMNVLHVGNIHFMERNAALRSNFFFKCYPLLTLVVIIDFLRSMECIYVCVNVSISMNVYNVPE
jgi:hypothetical protein